MHIVQLRWKVTVALRSLVRPLMLLRAVVSLGANVSLRNLADCRFLNNFKLGLFRTLVCFTPPHVYRPAPQSEIITTARAPRILCSPAGPPVAGAGTRAAWDQRPLRAPPGRFGFGMMLSAVAVLPLTPLLGRGSLAAAARLGLRRCSAAAHWQSGRKRPA